MPIKDLLWACPVCHQIESIAADGRCAACGARFSRGRGARIRAVTAEGTEELHPREWLAHLPWPDLDCEGRALPAGLLPPFRQAAQLRIANAELPLRRGAELLGFIEKFGAPEKGELELTDSHMSFQPGQGSRSQAGWSALLSELTAIQPSSSSIQLKGRGKPVVSVRFPDGSLRLWEQRLQYCVRRAYEKAGQGTISEFQPVICVR